MAYEENQVYAKYLKDKITSEGGGCDDCNQSSETDDCGCCPPGLIATYDESGNKLGCLTPADSEEFLTNNKNCPQGYVALYDNTASKFLGCVSEATFADLYEAVNPAG